MIGLIFGPSHVIAKDVKLYLLLLGPMRDINIMSRGMHWPQTGTTHYQPCTAQLGLSDKVRAIKGWVVYYALCRLVYIKGMNLRIYARCVGLVPCCG